MSEYIVHTGLETGRNVAITKLDTHNMEFAIWDTQNTSIEVTGYVKWDGCVNWQTVDSCMAHACNPEDFDSLAHALKWARDEGGERIVNADQSAF